MKEHLEAFKKLFEAQTKAYGVTRLTGQRDARGKALNKSFLIKKPFTDEIWLTHLADDDHTVGAIPIMDDSHVKWAALDIDVYNNQLNFNEVLKKTADTPFVVCRSKSGGAHLYVFFNEPVPAGLVIQKMESLRAGFGHADAEIFPKQYSIQGGTTDGVSEYGNFINLPYNGPNSLKYCVRNDETDALSITEFFEYSESKRVSLEEFQAITNGASGHNIFPDGPPCLNTLFGEKVGELDMCNNALANAAVYFKKANPEEWKEKLNELNQTLEDPLDDRRLEAIKKSYDGKDYKYQCGKEPIKRYCDSRVCKTCRYGVDYNELVQSATDLTQIQTDPPTWVLVIQGKAIRLSTDQLFSFKLFAKRCAEVLTILPKPIKQPDWEERVTEALETCKKVYIPKEMTPTGVCISLIDDFFDTAEADMEVLMRGMPYRDAEHIRFKMKDLTHYLNTCRFTQLKPAEITSLLSEHYKAETKTTRIKDKTIRTITCPHKAEAKPEFTIQNKTEDPF
jgi:hypothetical protein